MAQTIRDVMTPDPILLSESTPIIEVARTMKQQDIGNVLVTRGDELAGIVTDRDVTVRAVAEAKNPETTNVGEIISGDLVTLSASDSVEDAISLMREKAIRRVPVLQDGTPVGVVAIGDLAVERDTDSALADISSQRGNN